MSSPLIQVVDDKDTPIGVKPIQVVRDEGLWHRYIRVVVKDSNDNYLLQLRSAKNYIYPEYWDFSVAGHVDDGESYLDAAKRESLEELGIGNISLEEFSYFISEESYEDLKLNRFNKIYETCISPVIIKIDKNEVSQVEWFSKAELKQMILSDEYRLTPSIKQYIESL